MSKKCKRDFKVYQTVYLVDYWGTDNGTQAFEALGEILKVDEEHKTFDAVLYGDSYRRYSFKDYGRLFFDTEQEATEAARKLPKPKSVIYKKIGKRVYKRTVLNINGHYVDGVFDLILRLNRGKDVSTKEIGISVFLNEAEARQ